MDYKNFLKEKEQIDQLSADEQKIFYRQLLKNKRAKTRVRVHASFCYGRLFYQEGDFRKTIEILEPIVVDYESYPYTPALLLCFNLIGAATHCESEYYVSRFFYETALKIAQENNASFYYAFEYNNIAVSYIMEQNYPAALQSLERAETVLKDCDDEMGTYIYINKSISLQKVGKLPEALLAFETGVKQYHADEIITDDVLRCAATLYYKLGQTQLYENYKAQILAKLTDMDAAEFMDACNELFACGLDSHDDLLMSAILHTMKEYVEKFPHETKAGLLFSELSYSYAVEKKNKDAIIDALEKKNAYKDQIILHSMENKVTSLKHYLEINSQISDLESDALTGFKNRKTYYRDIDIFEHDNNICMHPVGVVFADVNGLKEINDRLGHEAGDEMISAIAGTITKAFPEAKRYRFGGDEFVILSFDKNEAAFRARLKKLSGLWTEECSASIGSIWMEHAQNFEENVAVADKMMYREKHRYYEKSHNRTT